MVFKVAAVGLYKIKYTLFVTHKESVSLVMCGIRRSENTPSKNVNVYC